MRILHVTLRVTDLKRSISFYSEVLGMDLLRKEEHPEGNFKTAFLGYADKSNNAVLKLTHNRGVDGYQLGDAYGPIGIEVADVYQATHQIRRLGGRVLRDAGPMHGESTVISVIEDPDGYLIELIGTR